MALLEKYKNDIIRLCENYRVRKLYAFGSVLSSRFSQESDIDLIVEFKTRDLHGYADNYFNFKSSLEEVFQRPVDLLEEQAIKNPFSKRLCLNSDSLFMEIEVKAWLYDVLNAIIEIEGFFATNNINFPEYQNNIMFRRAVERNMEIIGEAVNRGSKIRADY